MGTYISVFSGTNEDIIVKLIGTRASTDEIRIENRGNVAQTNQIDQFDIAHEGSFKTATYYSKLMRHSLCLTEIFRCR